MVGRARWVQSVEAPSRTKRALVKATKDMVMAKMPTQMPLWEASAAVLRRTREIAAAEICARVSGAASAATCGWMVVDMLLGLFDATCRCACLIAKGARLRR